MNAAKTEAESYFDINFPPMRYGQDNRCITAIPESNSITNSIASIKGYSAAVGRKLFESSKTTYVSFIDLLRCLDKLGIKAAKYEPLIKIDYFQQFGNQRELFEISRLWGFFSEGSAKSLKRKAVEESGIADIIARHATDTKKDGSPAATYTLKTDEIMDCMREGEQHIRAQKMNDLEMKVKVQNSIDVLGYVDVVTQKEEDRRRLIITDVTAMKSNGEIWGHRVGTKSLGSGKTARLTVRTDRYNMTPIKAGDIVYATGVYKNPKGYWYLTNYHIE